MEALLMACSLSILCVCCASTEVKTVNVYNSVILEGCCDISHDRLWKFNTELVYSNHLLVNDTFDGIMSLFSNYSLVIDSITLDLDGFYQCICNLGQYISMQNYSLVVEVSPSLSITAAENQVRELLNIAANEPSRLVCQAVNAKPVANLTWMINDRAIPSYAGIQSIFPNPNGTFNTISSYTLTTSEVVSNVSCISKQLTSEIQRVDVTINTYVIPTISFTINGIDATNTVTVQYETMLTAVCQTIGGRPPSNITWVIDGQLSNVVTDGMVTVQTGNTFTSTSQMSIPATMSKGQITCLVSIGYPDSKVELHGIYHTYVLPSVFVTINGHRKVEVSRDRSVSVVCRSVGSRPKVNLLILTGHHGMDSEQPTVTSTNSEINDTYDTITSINFTPTKERGNVTCVVQGLLIKDVSSYATYVVIGEAGNKEDNLTLIWLIVGGFVATVIMLLLGVLIYFLKKNLSLASLFSHGYQDVQLNESNLKRINTASTDVPAMNLEAEGEGYHRRLSRHTGRGSSFFDATSGELPKPPSLALPEVPTFPEVVEYSDVPEHAYYSAVTETATVGRIFHVNNMRMMLKMKMGLLYNRWMGTIGASNAVTKSVLITTISDEALQRKDIHWDDFVRRLLEMSINRSISMVEGICIDSAHLYLLQEYFVCETLDSRLNMQNKDGKTVNPIDQDLAAKSILGILEGMEAIHSYGFLHPDLCTKKILLTSDNVCKIYDFCLAEDAARTVMVKKSKKHFDLNNLPPEALQRNEYSWTSDMWSIAVVIWEVLSAGKSPFVGETSTDNINMPSPIEAWPVEYRKELLFQCWETDCTLRPNVADLRMIYSESLSTSKTETRPISVMSGIMDHYVPMKGGPQQQEKTESSQ
ncbi:uncharacterized protein [Apostichopus japonicus]|uniref:uncharacterized protein isoform X2 n=1 Tax=Stichopus japonicus TaxID=307972 RepID=UPI003AB2DB8E